MNVAVQIRSTPPKEPAMPTIDPRIDAYIATTPEFARPILQRLRKMLHKACPDIVETMKWSTPSFEYKGIFAGIAAFKKHCLMGFWKDTLLRDKKHVGDSAAENARVLDALGRMESTGDLPSDAVVLKLIKQAAKLNDDGVKAPMAPRKRKPPLRIPPVFASAMKGNKIVQANFEQMSPSHKREYIAWIVEAKTDETRDRRIATAIEWIADGKSRHWKYQRK